MKIVGGFVAELRVERGLSRIELARYLEVSYKTVFLLEEGELEPDKELTEKIINFFEVTKEELISGRKQFNNDGSRAVSRDIKRKHKNTVIKHNTRYLLLGVVTVVVFIVSFIASVYYKTKSCFIISMLISSVMLFVFLKSERTAIKITNNEMLSEKVKFKYYSDIIKYAARVVCVGISAISLAFIFSFFSGAVIKILSVVAVLLVSAVIIFYTDRHLWNVEKISKERTRRAYDYYKYNRDDDKEFNMHSGYIDSDDYLSDAYDDKSM